MPAAEGPLGHVPAVGCDDNHLISPSGNAPPTRVAGGLQGSFSCCWRSFLVSAPDHKLSLQSQGAGPSPHVHSPARGCEQRVPLTAFTSGPQPDGGLVWVLQGQSVQPGRALRLQVPLCRFRASLRASVSRAPGLRARSAGNGARCCPSAVCQSGAPLCWRRPGLRRAAAAERCASLQQCLSHTACPPLAVGEGRGAQGPSAFRAN